MNDLRLRTLAFGLAVAGCAAPRPTAPERACRLDIHVESEGEVPSAAAILGARCEGDDTFLVQRSENPSDVYYVETSIREGMLGYLAIAAEGEDGKRRIAARMSERRPSPSEPALATLAQRAPVVPGKALLLTEGAWSDGTRYRVTATVVRK